MAKRILIADDDRALSNTTAEILRSKGYVVIEAPDAYQAIRLAHEKSPDLIILDIHMPAGGGISVIENLKLSSETHDIPILFTSGLFLKEAELTIKPDPKNYFTKPFEMDNLLGRIQELIGA